MWINSLNITGLYINELFSGLNDGIGILKLEEKVGGEGTVNWKKCVFCCIFSAHTFLLTRANNSM